MVPTTGLSIQTVELLPFPVHKNEDLPKGLLRKIIREDLDLDLDEFLKLYKELD
jgi:hypothetical protein